MSCVRETVSRQGAGRRRSSISAFVAVATLAATCSLLGGVAACAGDRAARQARRDHRSGHKFVELVGARAPFDLSCPPEQIMIVKLSDSALGARGCERQTSYTCMCTRFVWFACTQALCSLDSMSAAAPEPWPGPASPAVSPPPPPTML